MLYLRPITILLISSRIGLAICLFQFSPYVFSYFVLFVIIHLLLYLFQLVSSRLIFYFVQYFLPCN